ncbi:hypothetical protein E2C01_083565 [Portunus trituberculatus]|uniref:Uncharacterized protein n=1 Tax=Portunus trituberculatus TaxID=210409 RepID=A0A5B7J242_PORTR|nr:hypothetical protein [Portunus trituberculatus]
MPTTQSTKTTTAAARHQHHQQQQQQQQEKYELPQCFARGCSCSWRIIIPFQIPEQRGPGRRRRLLLDAGSNFFAHSLSGK